MERLLWVTWEVESSLSGLGAASLASRLGLSCVSGDTRSVFCLFVVVSTCFLLVGCVCSYFDACVFFVILSCVSLGVGVCADPCDPFGSSPASRRPLVFNMMEHRILSPVRTEGQTL